MRWRSGGGHLLRKVVRRVQPRVLKRVVVSSMSVRRGGIRRGQRIGMDDSFWVMSMYCRRDGLYRLEEEIDEGHDVHLAEKSPTEIL